MSDNFNDVSDADLDAMIYDAPSEHEEDLGEGTVPVSPELDEAEEQPEVTDDDDLGEEDSTEEPTAEEQTDDSPEETPEEGDTEEDEDKATETDLKAESEVVEKFQPLRASGKEYPIEDISELYKLASAGVGAQQKFQAIAGHKKSIMAADKAGVDLMDAVNLMANFKEDPKGTLTNMLKEQGIDPLEIDIDEVSDTKVKDHSVSDFEVQYDEIVKEIGDSPTFKDVQSVLLDQWDEASRDVFFKDPVLIKQLHEEMLPLGGSDKSMFELVSPIAEKMKLFGDTRSDFDIYMEARQKKVEEFAKYSDTKATTKPVKADNKAKKRKASPTTGKGTNSKTLDFESMSDNELDAFIAKLD